MLLYFHVKSLLISTVIYFSAHIFLSSTGTYAVLDNHLIQGFGNDYENLIIE